MAAPIVSAADAAPAPAAPPQVQPAAAAASAVLPLEEADPKTRRFPEAAIKRTVIEDRTTRIDELRVRGQLQKVTVSPKGDAPVYEVLTSDDAQPGDRFRHTSRLGRQARLESPELLTCPGGWRSTPRCRSTRRQR